MDGIVEGLERENAALRRAISLLHEISTLVRASLELEPTCYAVLHGVTAGVGLGLNRAMLFFADENDRNLLRGVLAVGPADAGEADRVWRSIMTDQPDLQTLYEAGLRRSAEPGELDRRVRETVLRIDGDSPVALAVRRSQLVHRDGSDDLGGLLHLETAVAAPVRWRGAMKGVLYADNRFTGRAVDHVTELVFAMLANQAGVAIETAHRYEHVARAARTDALTGLGHHGAMMEALSAAARRADVSDGSLGVVMIDLDDFKRINDTHGHLVGDALLRATADRLRREVRSGASVFRYGGEEFTVVLPGVDIDGASATGERLRAAIGEQPFALGDGLVIGATCSVGVAVLAAPRVEARALLAAADAALLEAKATGKNRVVRAV